jgi:adenylate cyclase
MRRVLAAYGAGIDGAADREAAESAVDRILDQEALYLVEMDRVVSLFEEKASSHVSLLRRAAVLLTLTSMLVLGFIALFLLKPAIRITRRDFRDVGRLLEDMREAQNQLEARNRFIEDVFGRYVSDEVVDRLLHEPEGLDLAGEERKVTLLMTDLRGFTSLASTLPPRKTVQMLNYYLDRMTRVIDDHDGTISDFLGDCIFAVFGAPIAGEDDARRAVACALSIQREQEHVNEVFEDEGLPEMRVGIGIHTGSVIAGNVGSERRAKYGVVGPPVNLVSRLEDFALAGQTLISEATLGEVGEQAEVATELVLQVKGIEGVVRAYELIGMKGVLNAERIEEEGEPLALREAFPVCYRTILGNQVGNVVVRAEIPRLSFREAEVRPISVDRCPNRPGDPNLSASCPTLSLVSIQDDVEISLSSTTDRILSTTVYAKVMGVIENGDMAFRARFTSVSPAARAIITGLLNSTTQTLEQAASVSGSASPLRH